MLFKSKSRAMYGDLVNEFRPTIKSLIFNILYAKFLELKKAKEPFQQENARFQLPADSSPYLDIKYLAVVKRGKVVEMIRVNEETAKLLEGGSVKFVPFDPQSIKVKKGMTFKDNEFGEVDNEEN
jgi:hypothetical protein